MIVESESVPSAQDVKTDVYQIALPVRRHGSDLNEGLA